MKAQIGDDAAARKEPGWKAKVSRTGMHAGRTPPLLAPLHLAHALPCLGHLRRARTQAAGVKEGKAITGCSDVGIGNSGGG